MSEKILIVGAAGQIGSELTEKLRSIYGTYNVIASDINSNNESLVKSGPFQIIDAKNYDELKNCITGHNINTVYLMAAMLSASAEKNPMSAWELNMGSLFHVLNLAKDGFINKVFWPSSIAVFGPSTPKVNTPQQTIMEPTTVYGISKLTGERWCEYYYQKFGVDVRSLRYPGIISYKTLPGGGTTDYAIDIFHKAISEQKFECFLNAESTLPMMYMDDAIDATIKLMQTNKDAVSLRSSYNLAAISFNPEELANSIKKYIPEFEIQYKPDFRQDIANSWPNSIDDSFARNDWNWQYRYNLDSITKEMINGLKATFQNQQPL
ncbi:NAD-dependent epimerase/dehydratase family protein [Paucihalobacter ruber]|uniref:NAD-dependent epimerase/dehydratase family protein n=1 Tax=Paucihalobacter ruber TaxID=2567861 RepID=A0A506PMD2_9FLAO|nr:NAD-dependent epimerase/dehydratase family protein [Paucihalobacter ruber]TPV34784.1 NAD-dependent epimerase/dehydratase family protein [Paucihalobacter ruber]